MNAETPVHPTPAAPAAVVATDKSKGHTVAGGDVNNHKEKTTIGPVTTAAPIASTNSPATTAAANPKVEQKVETHIHTPAAPAAAALNAEAPDIKNVAGDVAKLNELAAKITGDVQKLEVHHNKAAASTGAQIVNVDCSKHVEHPAPVAAQHASHANPAPGAPSTFIPGACHACSNSATKIPPL